MVQQRKRHPNAAGSTIKRKEGRFQCGVHVLQPDGTRARGDAAASPATGACRG
ncbi:MULTISPECIES: hypothetical protein [unclassified Streptomyces]|uniref:hypothetical protein n=1 Tax=unclassified Streptomyces TaxID=2593676 RepID=UPI0033BEF54B